MMPITGQAITKNTVIDFSKIHFLARISLEIRRTLIFQKNNLLRIEVDFNSIRSAIRRKESALNMHVDPMTMLFEIL